MEIWGRVVKIPKCSYQDFSEKKREKIEVSMKFMGIRIKIVKLLLLREEFFAFRERVLLGSLGFFFE